MTVIGFSEVLQRRVRLGGWEDQKVSTYRTIVEALAEQRDEDAVALSEYFVDEAEVCWALYRQWTADLEQFLLDSGTTSAELTAIRDRTANLIRLPDGSAFDTEREWAILQADVALVAELVRVQRRDDAVRVMAGAKERWRQTHDRDVDRTYALMSAVAERYGDDAVPAMFERVLAPLFAWRYSRFDIDRYPWDEGLETLLYVACEAMRGHLVGPERTGDMALVEREDRYVLTFEPCGSGGRISAGDSIESTPPRVEPPYEWRVSQEPRDWNHFTPGVCLYCAHCIILMEHMPIDRFGYPVRVIDPPVAGDPERAGRCSWTMFKDPTGVPDEYYVRTGRVKPTRFGSAAHGGVVRLPDPAVIALPGNG